MTVQFADHPRGTKMIFTQTGFGSAASRDGHQGGWKECFVRLAGHLSGLEVEKSRPLRRYGHVEGILVVGCKALSGNPGGRESGNSEMGRRRPGLGGCEGAVGAIYGCGRIGRRARKVWQAMNKVRVES